MKKMDFARLKELDDDMDMSGMKVGDKFLYGKNIISQKSSKEVGQPITYYEVIEKEGSNAVFMPIYDILQEDIKDGQEKN